jgi:hypothetical protein
MKNFGFTLGLLALSVASAGAQVTVEVMQKQDQFLPGESLPAAVRITNRSGQTLRLGAEEDWLTFAIEPRGGGVVPRTGEAPVAGEFTLASSKMATKRVDLAPYFSLTDPGRYSIVATLRIKGWDREITSPPREFDVIEGAKLWEQAVGVPNSAGTNSAPEVRKYILQQANYLKGRIGLFLRVTDSGGGKTFRVFPIGTMVSFSKPEAQIDKVSNLHVLYLNSPHTFSYTVFNPAGDLITRQTYDMSNNAHLHLQVAEDGKISVAGGVRRLTADDLPVSTPTISSDDGQKP